MSSIISSTLATRVRQWVCIRAHKEREEKSFNFFLLIFLFYLLSLSAHFSLKYFPFRWPSIVCSITSLHEKYFTISWIILLLIVGWKIKFISKFFARCGRNNFLPCLYQYTYYFFFTVQHNRTSDCFLVLASNFTLLFHVFLWICHIISTKQSKLGDFLSQLESALSGDACSPPSQSQVLKFTFQ